MGIDHKRIDELIEKERKVFLADYKKIVESPSISSHPEHKKDIEETARIAREFLKQAGAEVTVYATKGNPIVFGHFHYSDNAPTVAIYNHLDVQPATKGKDGWTREPFTFTEHEGRFYSRGTTDDKGPAMTAFWAAKIARALKLPINIEFIWELEEEIGSPHFMEFLEKAKTTIKADSILVSDTIWIDRGKPSVTMGLRGLLTIIMKLQTGAKDVHSGVGGGAARNPLAELIAVISQCFDAKTGNITIPGFEKTWTRISDEEREHFVQSGFTVENFKKALGLSHLRYEKLSDVVERIWAMPTFEVHGIAGGYQEAGVKTVVPPQGEAKVSFRLVPPQNPDEIFTLFKNYIHKLNPDIEVIKEAVLAPYAAPRDLPLRNKIKEALHFAFGISPAEVREGGSIGAVASMDKILQKPILFMGLSLPSDGYHGPDESFAWEQIQGGVKAFVKYFELLTQK